MLYMLLCYNNETEVLGWTPEQDAAVMGRLAVVHDRLVAQGKMGPSGRLQGTSAAKTLVKTDAGHVGENADFVAGHPEKLVDFGHRAIHEMTVTAKTVVTAHYEVRPMRLYLPGAIAAE